jgi:hypothetical protein
MIVEVRRIYSNGYGDDYADFQPGSLMFEVGDKPAKYDSYYSCVCWKRTTCVASTARARARALTESWHLDTAEAGFWLAAEDCTPVGEDVEAVLNALRALTGGHVDLDTLPIITTIPVSL